MLGGMLQYNMRGPHGSQQHEALFHDPYLTSRETESYNKVQVQSLPHWVGNFTMEKLSCSLKKQIPRKGAAGSKAGKYSPLRGQSTWKQSPHVPSTYTFEASLSSYPISTSTSMFLAEETNMGFPQRK